jgi:hypothetical protein
MSIIKNESQLLKIEKCSIDNKVISENEQFEIFVSSSSKKRTFPLYSINFNNYYEICDIRKAQLKTLIVALSEKIPIKIEIGKNWEYRIPHIINSTIKRRGPILLYEDGNNFKIDLKDKNKNIWKPEFYLDLNERELKKFTALLRKVY